MNTVIRGQKSGSRLFGVKVESRSSPGQYYIVKIYSSGDMACTKEKDYNVGCVAYEMGRVCRHIKYTTGVLHNINIKAQEKYGESNKN